MYNQKLATQSWRERNKERYQEYQKKYRENLYKERKKLIFDLLGNKCVKCGSIDNLEIDHIDPHLKLFDVLNYILANIDKLTNEIKKCQLLCYDCHKEKTKIEKSINHG